MSAMSSRFWRISELRSDNRSWSNINPPLSKGRRLLPLIVRRVRCASDRSTIVSSKRTIIGGLGIRINPDDGKLHSQTPISAVEANMMHIVIKHRNDNVAHSPVPDGKGEPRLLEFLYSVIYSCGWSVFWQWCCYSQGSPDPGWASACWTLYMLGPVFILLQYIY